MSALEKHSHECECFVLLVYESRLNWNENININIYAIILTRAFILVKKKHPRLNVDVFDYKLSLWYRLTNWNKI